MNRFYKSYRNKYVPWYLNMYYKLYKTGCGLNMLSKGYNVGKIISAINSLKY